MTESAESSVEVVITLEQAYDRTLSSDQSIRRAYWEIRSSNLEPLSALTRLGPRLNGSTNLGRSSQTTRSIGLETTTRSRSDRDSQCLGLSLQQPIFDLSVIPAYRLGKMTAEAARLTYQQTIRDVLFGLTQTYYEVLKQQRVVIVSRDTLRLAQGQLDLSEARAEVGEVTRSDVLRARVTVESSRRTLIESQNDLASTRNRLANILNLGNTRVGVVEPPPYPASSEAFESLFASAMRQREDLRIREIAVNQEVERRNLVISEYTPRVVAQVNTNRSYVSGSSESRGHSWDATIGVTMPFFTGGQREIDLVQAGYQITQTRLDYEVLVKNVQQEVKDAWLEVRSLEQTLAAVRVQVEAAQTAYEDIRSQYQAGAATSVELCAASSARAPRSILGSE